MLNTTLSSRIYNAVIKSCPIGLNGMAKRPPISIFSLKNPYILEAIPDNYINTNIFSELKKLEGKKLDEVLPIINSLEKAPVAKTNPINSANSKVNLYEELARYYEQLAKKRIQAKEVSSAKMYNDFAQLARNRQLSEKDLFSKLYDQLYQNIRLSDYSITKSWNHKIADFTGKSNNYMMVQENAGWHYRIPHKRHEFGWSRNDKVIDRISVNANTDTELIAKLDEYFGTGKAKGYFKTPSDAGSWLERHDPITIYLKEPANQRILNDIENITRPHIRSTENVLVGNRFAPGLSLEKSPSTNEIEKLLAEISNINPTAGQAMREEMIGNLIRKGLPKDSPLTASAGQMTAMRRLLEML